MPVENDSYMALWLYKDMLIQFYAHEGAGGGDCLSNYFNVPTQIQKRVKLTNKWGHVKANYLVDSKKKMLDENYSYLDNQKGGAICI